ncbi:MAG: di-heme enzyme [Terriglobia bacterium]
MRSLVFTAFVLLAIVSQIEAKDAHGRWRAPYEALLLSNPLAAGPENLAEARPIYAANCASCHGADGKGRTTIAAKLPVPITNLTNYLMDSVKEGEIFWVISYGIDNGMPAFEKNLSLTQRWQLVLYVRELRTVQRENEKARLGPYEWSLPPGFPHPNVPPDNLMTAQKVDLGRHLFYDKRLSLNQTQACASCHRQELAFTDGRARGVGSTGQIHPRGSMSLVNVAYAPVLTWANPNVRRLESQALVPMFGEDPIELGMNGKEELLILRLRKDSRYQKLFTAAFPGDTDPFTITNITRAIACFERTILSGDSPYDRYRRGEDAGAISDSAKRGEALFFSERLECFHCHGGFNLSTSIDYFDKGFAEIEFHNTGLYNLKGAFSYPKPNRGLYEFTRNPEDVGKFKPPTLRNIAITGPYMHDGSVKTLEDAIAHYSAGGRTIRKGLFNGIGAQNPNKSQFVKPFTLTNQEKQDLLNFLDSLTDKTLLTDRRLSNPWVTDVSQLGSAELRVALYGEVVTVYPDEDLIAPYHNEVRNMIRTIQPPNTMEFRVSDRQQLRTLGPDQEIPVSIQLQNQALILEKVQLIRRP